MCSCGVLSFLLEYIVKIYGCCCGRVCEKWCFTGNVTDKRLNPYVLLMKYEYGSNLMGECTNCLVIEDEKGSS